MSTKSEDRNRDPGRLEIEAGMRIPAEGEAQVSMQLRVLVGTALAVVLSGAGMTRNQYLSMSEEEAAKTWTDLERSRPWNARVTWSGVSAPFKCFILVRDGEFLCAIRFTKFVRGRDARPPSIWSSGEETETSVFEWHVLAARDGGAAVSVQEGRDVVQFAAPKGFGHLIVSGGYGSVKCGDREFPWFYPDVVEFSSAPQSARILAPTKWSDIAGINLKDPSLVWYARDTSRKTIVIPRDHL